MNALSYLGHVAQLIREQHADEAGRWVVYIREKKINVKPTIKIEPQDTILVYLTRMDLEMGPTPKTWDRIDAALRRAIDAEVL